jgi:hypothetical protein
MYFLLLWEVDFPDSRNFLCRDSGDLFWNAPFDYGYQLKWFANVCLYLTTTIYWRTISTQENFLSGTENFPEWKWALKILTLCLGYSRIPSMSSVININCSIGKFQYIHIKNKISKILTISKICKISTITHSRPNLTLCY